MIDAKEIVNAILAASNDKICATELKFSGGKRRIDVWTLEPISSAAFRATAYEVKVTFQDFMRDSAEKQSEALKFSDRFFYVTPPKLVDKTSIPEWAGLLEWDGKTFAVKKKPQRREKSQPDWRFIVDVFRSAKIVRRDTNLFTAEIAALRHHINNQQRQMDTLSAWSHQKFLNRFSTAVKP